MADNKYPKEYRLLSANDFSNLRVDSKQFKRGILCVYFKNNNLEHSRLGISVSSKNYNAVFRNRFKRLIREYFRTHSLSNTNYDILFVVLNSKNKDPLVIEQNILNSIQNFEEFIKKP